MSIGSKFRQFFRVFVLCPAVLFVVASGLADLHAIDTTSTHSTHNKKTKKPQLPTLPSGPTGPVPQLPLDSIKPVAPQVSFQNGQLTIVAPNSTLGDILRAVRKQTGAEIEIPEAQERVVTHLGPGPARAIVAELLNGSRFNYVLLGSPEDASLLTRVVLVAKSGPDNPAAGNATGSPQPGQPARAAATPETAQDTNDAETIDDNSNADDNAVEQPPTEVAEPVTQPDQNAVKTPQQMLQEMQQRQMQFQQQQQQEQGGTQPPQPALPGPGMPQRQPIPPQAQ